MEAASQTAFAKIPVCSAAKPILGDCGCCCYCAHPKFLCLYRYPAGTKFSGEPSLSHLLSPLLWDRILELVLRPILSVSVPTKNAKRAASVHLFLTSSAPQSFWQAFMPFKISGDCRFGIILSIKVESQISIPFFNIVVTVLLVPFCRAVGKTCRNLIGTAKSLGMTLILITRLAKLDDRFLRSPSLALDQCEVVISNMGKLAKSKFWKIHSTCSQV